MVTEFRFFYLGLILLGFMGGFWGTLVAAEAEDPAALVKKLGDDDFDTRREAENKLKALGEVARPFLESALKAPDLQIVDVATALLSKLETSTLLVLAYDRDGKPALDAQADVSFYGENGGQPNTQSVSVGADGTAKLTGLTSAYNYNFVWKKWTPLPEFMNRGSLLSGVNPVMSLLSSGGTVTAVIKDKDGKPVKDAQVTVNTAMYGGFGYEEELLDLQLQLAAQWGWNQNTLNERSNAEGIVKIENEPEGVSTVVIQTEGYFSKVIPNVRIFEGETLVLPEIILEPRSVTKVSMILRSTDQTPLKTINVGVTFEPIFNGPNAKKLQQKYLALQQQMNMRRRGNNNPLKTDENGKVTVENITVGKSRLVVTSNNGNESSQNFGEVDIKAGAEGGVFDLGTLDFKKGETLRGKVVSSDNTPLSNCVIIVYPLEELEGIAVTQLQQYEYQGQRYRNRANTQQDGSYEVKNMQPGKYGIYVRTQSGKIALFFDVTVVAEKTTDAPDIVIPGVGKTSTDAGSVLKGRVLLPDGSPAFGALLTIQFENRGTNTNLNEKGEFDFSYMLNQKGYGKLRNLSISLVKYKTVSVDLSEKNLNLAALMIQLEAQDFSIVNVQVVDEAGVPIQGASVRPRPKQNTHNPWGVIVYPKIKTSSQGVARLTGIATGKRVLEIEKSGYFLKEEPIVTVSSEPENDFKFVLSKCISLKGKVLFPPEQPQPDSTKTGTVQCFMQEVGTSALALIQENGEFELKGLVPGQYQLFTTLVSFEMAEPLMFTIEKDKQPPSLSVPVLRRGGSALAVGKEFAGQSVGLVRFDQWPPKQSNTKAPMDFSRGSNSVDADGRVFVWGKSVGKYRLMRTKMFDSDIRQIQTYGTHPLLITYAFDAVDVVALKSYKELPKLPLHSVAASVTETGKLTGRLVVDSVFRNTNNLSATYTVWIVGKRAYGITSFQQYEFLSNGSTPIILGAPPPDYKVSKPGQFVGEGLPAGEYQVYLRYFHGTNVRRPFAIEPVEVAKFTLKEGQSVDIGNVKVDALAIPNEKNTPEFFNEAEDIVPVFRP